ncbi:MAG TPA: lysylphosphatidylglycerol synthase transmembrane domain-containing protein [Solirubrobacteraceae bacterium]|nr:lysylphosphatidylglycerol synthase transmembrane domain-containing protein [Solirubrobacteraceae bacterium]
MGDAPQHGDAPAPGAPAPDLFAEARAAREHPHLRLEYLRRHGVLPEEDPRLRHPFEPPGGVDAEDGDEEMPRLRFTSRNVVLGLVFIAAIVAFLYFVLPQIAGLDETWHRIEEGDPWWLLLAVAFTALSFGGYVLLFHHVYRVGAAGSRIGMAESYQITMAGLAATRLFAAGGAGGIALTAWAMRRAGMAPRTVADRTVAFLVLTYAVYAAALVVFGLGLAWGVLPGPAPWALTTLPAILALVAIGFTLLSALTPTDLERRLEGWARGGGRLARLWQRLAALPATLSAGVRISLRGVAERDPAIVGAILYWAFNIAVLWAAFRAFGDSPSLGVLVMGYFVGMLGNLLPLPGGVGGVDGGMIGAFLAFGVDDGLAVVAVLTYRAFAFWLPTLPGAAAYLQLRRTVARWGAERRAASVPAAVSVRA